MPVVASFEGAVLLGEGPPLLAVRLLEDGRAVWKRGADLREQVRLRVRVVLPVGIRVVCAKTEWVDEVWSGEVRRQQQQ